MHDLRSYINHRLLWMESWTQRETGALLSVVVFGIDLCQFLKTAPCERRFRTDAQFGARPRYAPTEPFLPPCLTARAIFAARAGEKERTYDTAAAIQLATCLRRLKGMR